MRNELFGRGVLTGLMVGIVGVAVLWGSVVVVTASSPRDVAGFLVVMALPLGPAIVIAAVALGGLLAALTTPFATVLSRGGPARTGLVMAYALLAFCCWGYLASVLPGRYLMLLPGNGPGANTAMFIVTATGATGGTIASLIAIRFPLRRPTSETVRAGAVLMGIGAVAGLAAWWVRRGGPSWLSGLPSPVDFVGSGYDGGQIDLNGDWIWGVITGATFGLSVTAAAAWTKLPLTRVLLASVAAGAAAYVSAVTGVMFPVIELSAPITQFPSAAGYATVTDTLPAAAIALTVLTWAVIGGLLAAAGGTALRLRSRTRKG